jgi:multimeric flavodoxin WrbA
MTEVLGFIASPMRNSDSEKLLNRFLVGAKDAGGQISKIRVGELGIAGWGPEAAFEDAAGMPNSKDPFQRTAQGIVKADVIAVATPVYFGNVPAQFKAMIDRSQRYWIRKYVDKKPWPASAGGHNRRRGILVSTSGNDRSQFHGTVATIKSFFHVYNVDYWGKLLVSNMNGNDIKDRLGAFDQAYDLGIHSANEGWE